MVSFRNAVAHDAPLVLWFIRQIAAYEKMSSDVTATEELIRESVFGKGRANVIFAVVDGREVGFALYFYNFSTFTGRPGLYLEDIYVMPEYRGMGIGRSLFLRLVEIAESEGCGRMEWVCLDWNEPSIAFYKSLGAVAMDDWTIYRLDRRAITALASKSAD